MKITVKDRKGDIIFTSQNYNPTTVQDLKLTLIKECDYISKASDYFRETQDRA